ncbi:putative serine/threonine protein kinase [Blattamonas nauphoetae]|uniref:non-specific serine/threonine protein kinase n=1 Tax=Blattamonas nauphoetae TaxID=2049346 RepID=A0ABQ9X2W8_9EUKA|nr:putative serine/threonine protein kinase [Blattamonas nauphoetae]
MTKKKSLVLTALRKTSGVVLDCGEGVCTVSAISNGFYLQGAQHRLPFGGRDITKFLIKTMFEAGYNFSSSSDFDIAREIKEDLSFVSDDYNADIQRGFKESPFPKAHTLPDGSIIELGVERFCCVEGFFHPNLLGYENGGIQDAILQAIMSCGVDVRSTLMKNIILTGGSTLSENFANRLQNELNEAVSEGANEGVDLFTVHAEKNRELLQWIGGSLLAKSARDQIGWITREKYSEWVDPPLTLMDEFSSSDEGNDNYRKGGYHPVEVGDILNDRYRVERKLGWGHFSTVWFCTDLNTEGHVAIKIIRSDPTYSAAARDEIKILEQISQADPEMKERVCHLLDSFSIVGPNGKHICIVTEALGPSLLSLIRLYNHRGIPLPIVRHITKQLLQSLDFLHRKLKIIHTDLKPENILLEWPIVFTHAKTGGGMSQQSSKNKRKNDRRKKKRQGLKTQTDGPTPSDQPLTPISSLPPADSNHVTPSTSQVSEPLPHSALPTDTKIFSGTNPHPSGLEKYNVRLTDFGNACWTYRHFTTNIQTCEYRAPESIIKSKRYNTSCDIWSVACLVFEMLTGDYLFEPKKGKDYSMDEDHLALIIELIGSPPLSFIHSTPACQTLFSVTSSSISVKHIKTNDTWPLSSVLLDKYRFLDGIASETAGFLLKMLKWDTEERLTAEQLLTEDWLKEDGERDELINEKREWEELMGSPTNDEEPRPSDENVNLAESPEHQHTTAISEGPVDASPDRSSPQLPSNVEEERKEGFAGESGEGDRPLEECLDQLKVTPKDVDQGPVFLCLNSVDGRRWKENTFFGPADLFAVMLPEDDVLAVDEKKWQIEKRKEERRKEEEKRKEMEKGRKEKEKGKSGGKKKKKEEKKKEEQKKEEDATNPKGRKKRNKKNRKKKQQGEQKENEDGEEEKGADEQPKDEEDENPKDENEDESRDGNSDQAQEDEKDGLDGDELLETTVPETYEDEENKPDLFSSEI